MDEFETDLKGAQILVVDDTPANIDVLCRVLEDASYRVMVASSGEVALDLARRFDPDLVLLDVVMPGLDGFAVCRQLKQHDATRSIPVIFLSARDDTMDLVEGFAAGGVDYVVKPFNKDEVLVRIRTHVEKAQLERELRAKNAALEAEIAERRTVTRQRDELVDRVSLTTERDAQRWGLDEFIGRSPTMRRILDDIDLLQSARQTSVLIQGESGTGKELVARAIHATSNRGDGPFVAVNCASIPHDLADSLLFGHKKGTFTGAERDQRGYFDLADGGTLFVDEVGEMPLELQSKLLRVLEERTVWPLGEGQGHAVDVRILAATNVDLQKSIAAGSFRRDLYFRLARFVVSVPPLRQRREDIELLTRHFLVLFADEMGVGVPELSAEVLARLQQHDYPGNVRELKNVIERAVLQSRGVEIQLRHLFLQPDATPEIEGGSRLAAEAFVDELPLNFAEAEVALIERALRLTRGNVTEAARLLGVDRNKIYRKLPRKSAQG